MNTSSAEQGITEQRAREIIDSRRMTDAEKKKLLNLWLRGERNARFIVTTWARRAA